MAEQNKTRGRGNSRPVDSVKAMKDASQLGRAGDALLKNKVLTKALDEMRSNAMAYIVASEPHETEKREDLYRFIKSIHGLEAQLKVYLNKGATAAKKLEEILKNGG